MDRCTATHPETGIRCEHHHPHDWWEHGYAVGDHRVWWDDEGAMGPLEAVPYVPQPPYVPPARTPEEEALHVRVVAHDERRRAEALAKWTASLEARKPAPPVTKKRSEPTGTATQLALPVCYR